MPKPAFQAPKGTRDLYPLEAARRRWLLERWRRVSIRHGFDEIDGPTFEPADLYAVKSGEGILSELFQAFSGKDPAERDAVQQTGRAPYALRPEFTPTLARMYAAQAASLPKPTRWFMAGPFFRAEKPQRGRLREFLQWNADILGDDSEQADADVFELLVDFLSACGLTPEDATFRWSHRSAIRTLIRRIDDDESHEQSWFAWLDAFAKRSPTQRAEAAYAFGATEDQVLGITAIVSGRDPAQAAAAREELQRRGETHLIEQQRQKIASEFQDFESDLFTAASEVHAIRAQLKDRSLTEWFRLDPQIVRGLAYYTGTVFEVIADGERALAGGGRYDNLVELFGGPPTPAVGFGMGDVVLTNVLQNKSLMPSDRDLLDEIGARPDVFLITPHAELDATLASLLSTLRRRGLHARRTTKTTRNLGKLLKDAANIHAHYAVIVESETTVTLKNLDTSDEHKNVPAADIETLCRPTSTA
ncbi:MAG: ATP phosphoribosyltransferase regulatory subunit [Planctomycetota bacterium]